MKPSPARPIALAFLLLFLAACSRTSDSTPAPAKPASTNPPPAAASPNSTRSTIAAPVEYIGAVGAAQKSASKTIELVSVQQAIQQYQAAEGKMPGSLQQLVDEGYLHRLPQMPAGTRLQFNPSTGEIRAVKQ